MEDRITCGLWLLAFLSGCGRLCAFNLDTDNVLRKSGDPGSLFGFSLAMHRQLLPQEKRMLLVGAPKAKALPGQKSKVTGGLYSCDMSTTSTACDRVIFDNDEDLRKESKENQWMGVTVQSQGIFVLIQDLKIHPESGEDGGEWHFCASRPRGHEMFGSCQQGLSATFDRDYHYLIFGAPGTYNWRGVVRLEQKNNTFLEMDIFDDGPFETGDESEMNQNLVPAPANSYLGFSLDSGKSLTKKGQLTVVAGAPRANHSGAVVLLKTGPSSSKILLEEYILEGEGLASSFGYDLAVLDLNGDSWQDIVVGAPQYFEKDGEIGGAVYVYINNAGNWNQVKRTRIDGPKDSMFGLAVENLGDINQDGYHDFAVGSPYENDGTGNVYIYHGSATGLSSTKAAQVLHGKSSQVKLFGYSLAGNMDLDKNSYPDLVVGSLSDSVFLFKARPVINIQKEIKFSPNEIDLSKKNCGSSFCLSVEACFTYTANPKIFQQNADDDYKKNGFIPRVTFTEPSASNNPYESKGTISLNSQGAKQCVTRKIEDNIRDKLHGIPIDVSVSIPNANRKRRQSSASQPLPVLDSNRPMITRSVVNFLKLGCGTDNLCQSNLKMEYRFGRRTTDTDTFTPLELDNGVPVISLSDQKDIALEVKVTNEQGDDAYEASLIASFPPSLAYSAYRSAVSCIANKDGTKADCELGNPFKRGSTTTFYIIMGTSGISLNTTELEIDLQLKTTSDQPNIAPVKAKVTVAIVLQLSVSGQAQPSQAYFTGEVKGEAAMMTESDIGSAITHQFRIINLGSRLTDFGTAFLKIEWPKETEQGKWLLYLMKISSTGVDNIACTPKNEINSLKMKPSNTRTRRAAKNTQNSDEGTLSRLIETKKSTTLVNKSLFSKCKTITCPLQGLGSNAIITLHSRLWSGTFIEVKKSQELNTRTLLTILMLPLYYVLQVRLTVFPERQHSASYGGVPWWIIVLSILLGLLLLGLLAFLLWKCGFFNHAKYEDKVPSYSAVRIKREERTINPRNGDWENLEKKPWMTTWHRNEHYS
uniref:Integrin alpha-2 domain-containing protein n=1 Tax=Anabas testudineus TaxID=64144 RepID=A0A7N6BWJ2_ANATE